MPSLELHKRADKSGPEPAPGQPWPLTHVELVTPIEKVPEVWGFSMQYVERAIADGWMEWRGSPLSHEIEPDPGGPYRMMQRQTVTYPGNRLALKLVDSRTGEPVEIVYRVTDPPEPHFWRDVADGTATHDFTVELVA